MGHPTKMKVTQLLAQLQTGNRDVLDELFSLVYDELRSMAQAQRRGWEGDYTLNTTGLVHEAYLKLVDQPGAEWESRTHFLISGYEGDATHPRRLRTASPGREARREGSKSVAT